MQRSPFLSRWLIFFGLATSYHGGKKTFHNTPRVFRILVLVTMAVYTLYKLISTWQYRSMFNRIHDLAYFLNYLSVELMLYFKKGEIAEVIGFIVDQTYHNPSFSPACPAYTSYVYSSHWVGVIAVGGSVLFSISWSLVPVLPFLLHLQRTEGVSFSWLLSDMTYAEFYSFFLFNTMTITFGATLYIFWFASLVLAVLKVKLKIQLIASDLIHLNERVERQCRATMEALLFRYKRVPACRACEGLLYIPNDQGTRECCKKEFQAAVLRASISYCFRQIFQLHQEIIRVAQLLDRTYYLSLLMNNQFAIMLIAFSVLPIMKVMNNEVGMAEFYLTLVETLGWIISTGSLCYVGQILIDESDVLRRSTYDYCWFGLSLGEKRSLLLMQTVATRDLKLSAGAIYTVNVELFATILKATYTYMNVLQALNSKSQQSTG